MRYLVRERLFDIKDDFWVTDEIGNEVFAISARVFSPVHHTLTLRDAGGRRLAEIKHRPLSFTDTMEIEHDGAVAATVHRAMFSPLRHRAIVDLDGGGRWEAVGDLLDKDFEITGGDRVIARVSRHWFRVRDSYGVDIPDGENAALLIAIAVCLDRIHHDEQRR